MIDATVRLLPGAMSDAESARGDSFYERGLSAPSYTRPPEYRGHAVPEVLLSGDHARIAEWRRVEGARLTRARQLAAAQASDAPGAAPAGGSADDDATGMRGGGDDDAAAERRPDARKAAGGARPREAGGQRAIASGSQLARIPVRRYFHQSVVHYRE